MSTNNVFEIRSLLQNAQSVLIALSETPDEDAVAAGLALYLSLSKMRKQVAIVTSAPVKVAVSHLFSVDKITSQMAGGSNLVISMPYEEGSIEKVSYHIDNNRFNVVIEPRGDRLKFDTDQVEYHYGRGDYDVVFVLGAHNVSALGDIYQRHKNIFTQKPLINIDKSEQNTRYGRINMVDDVPVSQSVTQLVKDLRLPVDEDIASNLYTGMMERYASATLGGVDPRSLDALSFLGRMKARNLKGAQNNVNRDTIQEQTKEENGSLVQQSPAPRESQISEESKDDAPEDWLKPKIFTTHNNDKN